MAPMRSMPKAGTNMTTRVTALLAALIALSPATALRAQESGADDATPAAPFDLLDLANGAVVLSATSEYDQSTWSALSLIDATSTTGWASKQYEISNNTIVVELPTAARIETFVVDTRGVDGAGRGARGFTLSASATSASDGFEPLLSDEAPNEQRTEFTIQSDGPVRWLRLTVTDNWGAADYTEIMELEAYGAQEPDSEPRTNVEGVYDTNYNLMRLSQDGRTVEGCYDWDNGTLTGDTDGRVIRFEWREDGPQIGTAIMVLTADAKFLNGLWYENSRLQGVWFGALVTDGREPECKTGETNIVAAALEASGSATLYGIQFDLDSAQLRSESTPVLNTLLAALSAQSNWRIAIEGHTDSQGSDSYNLDLSESRADAVKSWLVENGIDAARIETSGKGESAPEADNVTPQGRALNRRVVVRVIS